jgi:23S rRNA (uracil1939-C5)-methyltransferase
MAPVVTKSEAEFQVEIEDMTLGPYGVGRIEGKAVLVANSAPGDLLRVSIAQSHRDYWVAEINSITRPGPARRCAPCVFLPRCGGCDWQHITYPEQTAAKGRLIAAQLGRALGLHLDPDNLVVPARAEFGYRSRLRLKVSGGNSALGFYEAGSNRLVEVDRCLVANEQPGLEPAQSLARALAGRCDEIEIVASGDRQALVAYMRGSVQPADIKHADRAIAANGIIAGIILRGRGDRVVSGDASITMELEPGLSLKADADAFSQVNHECNRMLIASVMDHAAIESGTRVLDLFCGAGNFTLPAAKRGAQVLGVDADSVAISAAQRNAAELGLGEAEFTAMQVEGIAPFLLRARYRPQVVILDPPRNGARQLMKMIAGLHAARVVYVSCNVATLARDLRLLVDDGYAVSSVKAFDFFPNTHHCEVMALLT